MSRSSKVSLRQTTFTVLILFLAFAAFRALLFRETAFATQPPPPVTYELDISRSGGDDNCFIAVEPPIPTEWHSDSVNEEYVHGTELEVVFQTVCPTEYSFDHWQSNESSINGNTGNHLARFNITKDTWVIAYFAAIAFKATALSVAEATFNYQTGNLVVELEWESTSGNLADLTGQKVFETLANDTSVSFNPEVLEFLCTGERHTEDPYQLPSPWDSLMTEQNPAYAIFTTGHFFDAEDGGVTDTQTRHAFPLPCNGQCSRTLKQWFVGSAAGNYSFYYNPVVYEFHQTEDIWYYCISSYGATYCTVKSW